MSDKYTVTLTQSGVSSVTGNTGTDAVGELLAGVATHRPRIYDLVFSQGSAPADTVIRWEVQRVTATATATSATEVPLDPDAPPADSLSEEEVTVAGTVTADTQFLDFDLNQRATFRWVAAPGGEIVLPATAAAGVAFNASSASYTGIARITVMWEE